jgi:hypothetical protein
MGYVTEQLYGYHTNYGYMGLVFGQWILFATESEYSEYVKESIENEDRIQPTYGDYG